MNRQEEKKEEYLEKEYQKSIEIINSHCDDAKILLDQIIKFNDNILFGYQFSLLPELFIVGKKSNLEKKIIALEKELYKIKIIINLKSKLTIWQTLMQDKLAEREEGEFIETLKLWRMKNIKNLSGKIDKIQRVAR